MEVIQLIDQIGEELRVTRVKETGDIAFEYVYNKHKDDHLFHSFSHFLKVMRVWAVFFASRGEETVKDRENTTYIYI